MEKTNLVEACEKAADMMIEILNTVEKRDIRVEAAKALAMLTEASVHARASAVSLKLVDRLVQGDKDLSKASEGWVSLVDVGFPW